MTEPVTNAEIERHINSLSTQLKYDTITDKYCALKCTEIQYLILLRFEEIMNKAAPIDQRREGEA